MIMFSGTDFSLTGRIGLVTGGGTGIGLYIAQGFAYHGAKVYITGRRLEVLEQAANAIYESGGSLVPLAMDVTDEASVLRGAESFAQSEGKLDILVNNAGVSTTGDRPTFIQDKLKAIEEGGDLMGPETFQGWEELTRINFIAPFFVIKAFTALLIKGTESRPDGTSSIINVSSIASKDKGHITTNSIAYGPSKAALDSLTITLANHFARSKVRIRCNGIAPGAFVSEMVPSDSVHSLKDTAMPGCVAPIPMGRAGTDVEMARTAVYLATSDYTNGVILLVDGGNSLVNP